MSVECQLAGLYPPDEEEVGMIDVPVSQHPDMEQI